MTGKPPPPLIQNLNELLQREPFSIIFNGAYWSFCLLVYFPLAGFVNSFFVFGNLVRYFLGWSNRKLDVKELTTSELAVVITGCDSGFGKDVAFDLGEKGFKVFAGCLVEDSLKQFEGEANVTPILLNVTKDEDVASAADLVKKWLGEGQSSKKRYLHAIINNAGVGHGGMTDWVEIEKFIISLDVNFFGHLRMVKAFYPILKSQAAEGTYSYRPRIINVTSMAGRCHAVLLTPYVVSKFAAEGFSASLRLEMKPIGVDVVSSAPSFHETPLTNNTDERYAELWDSMTESTQKEYGKNFCDTTYEVVHNRQRSVMWRSRVVTRRMSEAVQLVSPPEEIFVGSDARTVLLLLRHLPPWLRDLLIPTGFKKPAMLGNNS